MKLCIESCSNDDEIIISLLILHDLKTRNMKQGFLYIANRQKFIDEALVSVQSLKRYNEYPICLVCTAELYRPELREVFDEVIIEASLKDELYLAKIIGMRLTPFERTVFLDADTFVTDTIAELFDVLDLADFATTTEEKIHTIPLEGMAYSNIIPEFNTGVIVYKNNAIMQRIMDDWYASCQANNWYMDMPGLREAVIKNWHEVRFSILPKVYNEHGFATMLILYRKVKIIHERIGYYRRSYSIKVPDFETMDRFARKINRITTKRLYVPRIGVIHYRYSPENLLRYLKKKLGYRRVYKNVD